MSASFVANGVRFRLETTGVLEPWERPTHGAPPGWMSRLALATGHDDTEYHGDTRTTRHHGR